MFTYIYLVLTLSLILLTHWSFQMSETYPSQIIWEETLGMIFSMFSFIDNLGVYLWDSGRFKTVYHQHQHFLRTCFLFFSFFSLSFFFKSIKLFTTKSRVELVLN